MSDPRISVLGTAYSLCNRERVEKFLLGHAMSGGTGYVCVWNVHTTMTAFFERDYQRIGNESLLTIPDGMPLVWAMRSLGAPGQDRVRGPSLMRALLDQGRARGAKHYLYGGSPQALAALQEAIAREYPGAKIVGAESPPFRPLESISDEDWQATAARINGSGAHFVWVGLGAPKQERWMWRQRGSVKGVMLGVGAAFDLLPGLVPEAPALLQSMGLEWVYRLWREPRRLWRRYVFNNPAFLVLWAGQWLAHLAGKNFRRK
jgi:N-acetylglucosaminyldiphosphoundecaprenol N-acetyl-beta-D-mannosaminyltransferase